LFSSLKFSQSPVEQQQQQQQQQQLRLTLTRSALFKREILHEENEIALDSLILV
tara:strand:- start:1099 stop:1260 length:162 start_codon:yes stop_codon:yes gene_type:complete